MCVCACGWGVCLSLDPFPHGSTGNQKDHHASLPSPYIDTHPFESSIDPLTSPRLEDGVDLRVAREQRRACARCTRCSHRSGARSDRRESGLKSKPRLLPWQNSKSEDSRSRFFTEIAKERSCTLISCKVTKESSKSRPLISSWRGLRFRLARYPDGATKSELPQLDPMTFSQKVHLRPHLENCILASNFQTNGNQPDQRINISSL